MIINSDKIACKVIYEPKLAKYDESIRLFQGCPSVAVTKGGRIFVAWCAGGICEPDMDNYDVLIYSDDNGETWSKPVLVIDSSKEHNIHALDPQLWVDPLGRLHMFWVQNDVHQVKEKYRSEKYMNSLGFMTEDNEFCVRGYCFSQDGHSWWNMCCDNPDEKIEFSAPRCLGSGFLRNKPLVVDNGEWVFCNYERVGERYSYSISKDQGKTYKQYYGAVKAPTPFDETMTYQMLDGRVKMFARTSEQEIAACETKDLKIWSDVNYTGINNPNTRFFIQRLKSGRLLLINNDHREKRINMTVYLSEDDGVTWKYKNKIDSLESSYPDADILGDKIVMVMDRGRITDREILLCIFTEEDIINNNRIIPRIISKPSVKAKEYDV